MLIQSTFHLAGHLRMHMTRLLFSLTKISKAGTWNLQRSRVSGQWSVVSCQLSVVVLLLFPSWGLANSIRVYVGPAGVKVLTNVGTERIFEKAEQASPKLENSHPDYSAPITKYADLYELDEDLIRAIIRVESNYDRKAVSPKGCLGLMQLHPDTARRFGVRDPFDPSQNIHGGVQYLHSLMDYFDRDLELVLAAYNAGENTVTRYQGIPPYRETREYVKKVTSLYQDFTPAQRRSHRIYRIVQPDGRILFTNHPTDSASLLDPLQ